MCVSVFLIILPIFIRQTNNESQYDQGVQIQVGNPFPFFYFDFIHIITAQEEESASDNIEKHPAKQASERPLYPVLHLLGTQNYMFTTITSPKRTKT